MGLFEAVVVIYLREIFYPAGFYFPLKEIPLRFLSIEIAREISTIIMLIAISIIAGKNLLEKFCYFIYSFSIWDIFYYVWLKVTLNWPSSLFNYDILFLIPVPWVAPVLAPVICCITMIFIGIGMLYVYEKNGAIPHIKFSDLILILSGGIIIIISFVVDYISWVARGNRVDQFVPVKYYWGLLITGNLLALISFLRVYLRNKTVRKLL